MIIQFSRSIKQAISNKTDAFSKNLMYLKTFAVILRCLEPREDKAFPLLLEQNLTISKTSAR